MVEGGGLVEPSLRLGGLGGGEQVLGVLGGAEVEAQLAVGLGVADEDAAAGADGERRGGQAAGRAEAVHRAGDRRPARAVAAQRRILAREDQVAERPGLGVVLEGVEQGEQVELGLGQAGVDQGAARDAARRLPARRGRAGAGSRSRRAASARRRARRRRGPRSRPRGCGRAACGRGRRGWSAGSCRGAVSPPAPRPRGRRAGAGRRRGRRGCRRRGRGRSPVGAVRTPSWPAPGGGRRRPRPSAPPPRPERPSSSGWPPAASTGRGSASARPSG